MPLTYWVTAEVGDIKVNYSGHCYMQLVEKGTRGGQPRAAAQAVAWRSSWGSIAAHFRASTGGEIAPGMQLLLRVSVSYHELYGLSLQVSDIDPAYTLGDIERQRQATIMRLQQEGVFGMNREMTPPIPTQRLAVVSSRNAAGYQDFIMQLSASGFHFHTTLFDAFMQGDAASESIIAALDAIASATDDFDAVVIIRGGGSQSDLSCFNDYRLCAHIAQFPLPVITGIGHDKDRSVADMVACMELKTPTAVAAYLIDGMAAEWEYLSQTASRLEAMAQNVLTESNAALARHGIKLSQAAGGLSRLMERRLDEAGFKIALESSSALSRLQHRAESLFASLTERCHGLIKERKAQLDIMAGRADSRDPARIMALGFAIVRAGGKTLRDSRMVEPGEPLEITLTHGRIYAKAEKTDKSGN